MGSEFGDFTAGMTGAGAQCAESRLSLRTVIASAVIVVLVASPLIAQDALAHSPEASSDWIPGPSDMYFNDDFKTAWLEDPGLEYDDATGKLRADCFWYDIEASNPGFIVSTEIRHKNPDGSWSGWSYWRETTAWQCGAYWGGPYHWEWPEPPALAYEIRFFCGSRSSKCKTTRRDLGWASTEPSILAPSDLRVAGVTNTSISLEWEDNSDNEDGFELQRSEDEGANWTVVATLPAGSSAYADEDVEKGDVYNYRVRATIGSSGSSWSNVLIAQLLPTTPQDLSVTSVEPPVDLVWSDSIGEDYYELERSSDAGATWSWIASPSEDATTFTDATGSPESEYAYRIRAVNDAGASGWSNMTRTDGPKKQDDPSILSRFFPTDGQISVLTAAGQPQVLQWMLWDNEARIGSLQLEASDAYEHEAFFAPGGCWPGAYDRLSWDSNLPQPYLDTDLGDDPADGFSRAGGTGVSVALSVNTWYYHRLGLLKPCTDDGGLYKVVAQDSFRFPPQCAAQYELCVFPKGSAYPSGDPAGSTAGSVRDVVPYAAAWAAPSSHSWHYNLLENESFEDSLTSWDLSGLGTPTLTRVIGGAYEEDSHARLACGGTSGCSVSQTVDFPVAPTDRFTFEVGLRCAGPADCPVTLRMVAGGDTLDDVVSHRVTVPSYNGGAGGWMAVGFIGTGYVSNSHVQVIVRNDDASQGVDVDFATLHWSDND